MEAIEVERRPESNLGAIAETQRNANQMSEGAAYVEDAIAWRTYLNKLP